MEATFMSHCYTNLPGGGIFLNPSRGRRCNSGKIVKAKKSDDHHHHHHHEGRLVDENMIILRTRIMKMKMALKNGDGGGGGGGGGGGKGVPESWMKWEKEYFGEHYSEDVCEVVGLLQMLLMNTRPGVGLGLMVLVALSLPISAYIVMHSTSDVVQELVSKLHFICGMYL